MHLIINISSSRKEHNAKKEKKSFSVMAKLAITTVVFACTWEYLFFILNIRTYNVCHLHLLFADLPLDPVHVVGHLGVHAGEVLDSAAVAP